MQAEVIGFCAKSPVILSAILTAITLDEACFTTGSLRITSYARPGKLFTANDTLIVGQVGILKADPIKQIVERVVSLLHQSLHF